MSHSILAVAKIEAISEVLSSLTGTHTSIVTRSQGGILNSDELRCHLVTVIVTIKVQSKVSDHVTEGSA